MDCTVEKNPKLLPSGTHSDGSDLAPLKRMLRKTPRELPFPKVIVEISSLLPADSPRLAGEDTEHARTLAETGEDLPPILVHRPTMRIIDGMHRLRAAVLRGESQIEVYFFDGNTDAAFVLAVESN